MTDNPASRTLSGLDSGSREEDKQWGSGEFERPGDVRAMIRSTSNVQATDSGIIIIGIDIIIHFKKTAQPATTPSEPVIASSNRSLRWQVDRQEAAD